SECRTLAPDRAEVLYGQEPQQPRWYSADLSVFVIDHGQECPYDGGVHWTFAFSNATGALVRFPSAGSFTATQALYPFGVMVGAAVDAADWNLDGVVDSSDFFGFYGDLIAGDADYNLDGVSDSADFFEFLMAFFDR